MLWDRASTVRSIQRPRGMVILGSVVIATSLLTTATYSDATTRYSKTAQLFHLCSVAPRKAGDSWDSGAGMYTAWASTKISGTYTNPTTGEQTTYCSGSKAKVMITNWLGQEQWTSWAASSRSYVIKRSSSLSPCVAGAHTYDRRTYTGSGGLGSVSWNC